MDWLRHCIGNAESVSNATMITTTKATHGMLVTVNNYVVYQNPGFYEGNTQRNAENPSRATPDPDNINKNDTITDKNNKSTYSAIFEQFWGLYPRKREKARAFICWQTQLKNHVSPDDLIKAAQNYALECQVQGREERFIKHAATFLGPNRSYQDFLAADWRPLTPPCGPSGPQRPQNRGKERGLPVL
jgi:hypothetical protein